MQIASVIGLGCESFQKAYDGLYQIADRLGRHANDGDAPTWNDNELDGHTVIRASNRYFTWKRSENSSPVLPFPPDVDPQRTLESMAGENYEHTKDNEVSYMVCKIGEGGKLE